jgi:hypothetical protein
MSFVILSNVLGLNLSKAMPTKLDWTLVATYMYEQLLVLFLFLWHFGFCLLGPWIISLGNQNPHRRLLFEQVDLKYYFGYVLGMVDVLLVFACLE